MTADIARSRQIVDGRRALEGRISFARDLPLSAHVGAIEKLLAGHQVVIVSGDTGSGKSTQLPKICLRLGRGIEARIGHTQPRRLAARTIARRISEETRTATGSLIGYSIRFDEQLSPLARIKVMTDGVLLQEIHRDKLLLQYDTLIVDEVHERSLNIDFILGYVKRILPLRPDLKVILTSATVDARLFADFFAGAATYHVPERSHPVEVRYRPLDGDGNEDEMEMNNGIIAALEELASAPAGDVLVFLPGEREIGSAMAALHKSKWRDREILPLYARLGANRQAKIFRPDSGRRVVLATNVAETSVTVPGIRYVIDSGLARVSRYNPRRKLQQLPVEPIAQTNAVQRAGRCGREASGICIRLYSEASLHARRAAIELEIQRTNLAGVILKLKELGFGDIEQFAFAEPPATRLIKDGYTVLQEIAAIDSDRRLSAVGRRLARWPMEPRLARVVLSAEQYGCLAECLVIVSDLGIADPRERPLHLREAADRAHAKFADKRSDFLWFLHAWEFAKSLKRHPLKKRTQICRRRFLSHLRLQEWSDVHDQLRKLARELGLSVNATPASYKQLHLALVSGFVTFVGQRDGDGDGGGYRGCRDIDFDIYSGSALRQRRPRWLFAAEIVETRGRLARHCAKIEPQWLEKVAGDAVRRTYEAPVWDVQRGWVCATEIQRLYGLIINDSKQVDYQPVDQPVTRRIFIERALLDGDLGAEPRFLRSNRALIEHVMALESRARRRDLLVPRETLVAFYDARLPAEICSRRALMRWLRAHEVRGASLVMRETHVTTGALDSVATYLFPDRLCTRDMAFRLSYSFQPGHVEDGLTVFVPLPALPRLRAEDFDRLVPGMLSEKCTALLRTLPKVRRRQVSPIREYAMACVEAIAELRGNLEESMAVALEHMHGVHIPIAEFDSRALPDHLRCHFVIVDEHGDRLAAGRDLDILQASLCEPARSAFETIDWGIGDVASGRWAFATIPSRVEIECSSMRVIGYPALRDTGAAVELKVFESTAGANAHHMQAVAKLLVLGAAKERQYLRNNVLWVTELVLLAARFGFASDPIEALVAETVRWWCGHFGAARNKQDYDDLQTDFRRALVAETTRAARQMLRVLERGALVKQTADTYAGRASAASLDDIDSQLQRMMGAELAWAIREDAGRRYLYYLAAVERRMQRMDANPRKDLEKLHAIEPLWREFLDLEQNRELAGAARAAVHRLLEEYRVAVFAPELEAADKISEQRVKAALATLGGS